MGLFGLCYLAGATAAEMKEMKADQSVLSEQVVLETKERNVIYENCTYCKRYYICL